MINRKDAYEVLKFINDNFKKHSDDTIDYVVYISEISNKMDLSNKIVDNMIMYFNKEGFVETKYSPIKSESCITNINVKGYKFLEDWDKIKIC